jgi:lipid-binding SYLF domain-containing protein
MFAPLKSAAVFLCFCTLLAGCHTVPDTPQEQSVLKQQSDFTLEKARQRTPGVQQYLDTSIAYAVFPSVGKGGFVFAGGYGKGIVYENGAMTGYCDATQLTVGAQIGGESCSELVFFQTATALQRFKDGDLALDAQVSAIAMDQKAIRDARYQDGVAVLFVDPMGLMAEASAGGQKFRYVPTGAVVQPSH